MSDIPYLQALRDELLAREGWDTDFIIKFQKENMIDDDDD